MRDSVNGCLAVGFALLVAASSAQAHPSFAAQYDATKPVEAALAKDGSNLANARTVKLAATDEALGAASSETADQ